MMTKGLPSVRRAHLGLLEIDVAKVLAHLRRDLRDDWFPDVLCHADGLTTDFIETKLSELQEENDRGFKPTSRTVRDVPKPGGTMRYSLETTLIDRFVYQALVEEIALPLDALLAPQVFSHRCNPDQRQSFFKPAVGQWTLFNDSVRLAGEAAWVVEADLQSFYESIRLSSLGDALFHGVSKSNGDVQAKARHRYAVELLLSLLPEWCFAPSHGLPQNRDASSFLANQQMRPVDSVMLGKFPDYFRYMDDIRICVSGEAEARRALVELTRALRDVGLSLNARKTQIHRPGGEGHCRLLGSGDVRLRDIDNMWSSRSPALIARSLPYLKDLCQELITKRETGSRGFRFCVHRLSRLASVEDLEIELPEFSELKALVIDQLASSGEVADQLCGFLKAVRLSAEECESVEEILLGGTAFLYEWQRYHLVLLLLEHGFRSSRLLQACEQVLRSEDREGAVPFDLALLICGRDGNESCKSAVADAFKGFVGSHSDQRAALIALHELPFAGAIEGKVAPHVCAALKGTYRRVQQSMRGQYVVLTPKVPAAELIDSVSSYV